MLSEIFFKPVIYGKATEFKSEQREEIQDAYKTVELFFQPNDTYLVGPQLTIADISCGCKIIRFAQFEPINKKTCPKLYNWLRKLLDNECFHKFNYLGWIDLKKYLPVKYHANGDNMFLKNLILYK